MPLPLEHLAAVGPAAPQGFKRRRQEPPAEELAASAEPTASLSKRPRWASSESNDLSDLPVMHEDSANSQDNEDSQWLPSGILPATRLADAAAAEMREGEKEQGGSESEDSEYSSGVPSDVLLECLAEMGEESQSSQGSAAESGGTCGVEEDGLVEDGVDTEVEHDLGREVPENDDETSEETDDQASESDAEWWEWLMSQDADGVEGEDVD